MRDIISKNSGHWLLFGKLGTIFFLSLLLLIPVSCVKELIQERESYGEDAVKDISQSWGGSQIVGFLFLKVPYQTPKNTTGKTDQDTTPPTQEIAIFPHDLNIHVEAQTQERYRGIHKALLYTAQTKLEGSFLLPKESDLPVRYDEMLWSQAEITVAFWDSKGLTDFKAHWKGKAVEAQVSDLHLSATLNGQDYDTNLDVLRFSPVITGNEVKETAKFEFSISYNLQGSKNLEFIPASQNSKVDLATDWQHPSFFGSHLPNDRSIQDSGSSANWSIPQFSRSFPGWTNLDDLGKSYFSRSSFGVKFLSPVDHYSQSFRAAKYAFLFIFLTFGAFFLLEVLQKLKIHPIQYLMVGSALVLFFLMLVSLSEHVLFSVAYGISALFTMVTIALYSNSALKSRSLAGSVVILLIGLYGLLLIILQEQDYALLMGSTALFLIVSSVMYLTRSIDWYAVGRNAKGS